MRSGREPFRKGDIFKYLGFIGIVKEDKNPKHYDVSVVFWIPMKGAWSEQTGLMAKRMELIARREEYEDW